jgi:hypothetical protein
MYAKPYVKSSNALFANLLKKFDEDSLPGMVSKLDKCLSILTKMNKEYSQAGLVGEEQETRVWVEYLSKRLGRLETLQNLLKILKSFDAKDDPPLTEHMTEEQTVAAKTLRLHSNRLVAMRMKLEGHTYAEIGQAIGLSRQRAINIVKEAAYLLYTGSSRDSNEDTPVTEAQTE